MVCTLVALSATFISEHHGGPQLLYALLLGLSLNFLNSNTQLACGIALCARTVLRAGVALLGARITISQISTLGIETAVLVCTTTLLTIGFGLLLAGALRRSNDEGLLSGCAVGICGASAALAVLAVLPQTKTNERFALLTVVGVTLLSTVAMIIYPIGLKTIGFSDNQSGIFLGATIHDVAQVVAAAMILGDKVGDTATVVKLFRVALLMPISMAIALLYRQHLTPMTASPPSPKLPLLPSFLVVFVVLVGIGSFGLIPTVLIDLSTHVSRWMLVIAIAAAGIKTSFSDIRELGWKPVFMLVGETVFLATLVLTALLI